MSKKVLKSLVLIIGILILLYLSQNYDFFYKNNFFSKASVYFQNTLEKGTSWLLNWVFPKISKDLKKRGEEFKENLKAEFQNNKEKVKNYFSGIAESIFHPNNSKSSNCK